jgi:acylphosphatase
MLTRRLSITGRVQGVGFRYYIEHHARLQGVTGWVRNRRDGSVEALVQGTEEAIEVMIAKAHRGPRSAAVERVEVDPAEGSYASFEIRPTE